MQVLGEGVLRLDSFTADQLTRSEPHPARLKLKTPKGRSGGGCTLHLLLSWERELPKLKKAPDPPPATATPNTAKAVQPPQAERRAFPKQGLQTLPEGDEEGGGDDSDGGERGDDSDSDSGGPARRVDTQQANNAEDESSGDEGGGGGGGRRRSNGAVRSASGRSLEHEDSEYSRGGSGGGGYGARGDLAVLTAVRC